MQSAAARPHAGHAFDKPPPEGSIRSAHKDAQSVDGRESAGILARTSSRQRRSWRRASTVARKGNNVSLREPPVRYAGAKPHRRLFVASLGFPPAGSQVANTSAKRPGDVWG